MADEVFFVGTAVEVTPIRSVDRVKVGRGRRGPITEAIQQRFFQIVKGEAPDTHGWLQPVNAREAATIWSRQEPITYGNRSERAGALPHRPLRPTRSMHVNDLLKIAVVSGASDLHLKVGTYPMMRVRGNADPRNRRTPPRTRGRRCHGRGRAACRASRQVPRQPRGRPGLQRGRVGPFPLQRVPAARHHRDDLPRDSDARGHHRRSSAPQGAEEDRQRGTRPRPRHRDDG